MTVIFTLECTINIILFGLYFNGPESYLKNSWNKMDAFIVVLAISDTHKDWAAVKSIL